MTRKAPWPPGEQRLRALVEEALADAYDESQQRTGLVTVFEEHLALPFETKVLGVAVTVERIDLTAAGEIVKIDWIEYKKSSDDRSWRGVQSFFEEIFEEKI